MKIAVPFGKGRMQVEVSEEADVILPKSLLPPRTNQK